MIKFLIKGVLRDKSRSLFPVITVFVGVLLTVIMYSWVQGFESEVTQTTARFSTGHLKVMSKAYAEESGQMPNDLALIGVEDIIANLKQDNPDLNWTPRIKFGGLLDIPDENKETLAQGPVIGMAVDLFSSNSPENKILNMKESIVRGRLPENAGEILVSEEFANTLNIEMNKSATLISSTMYGSMSMTNFTIVGTVQFGVVAMDRGAMIADISDIQNALDMQDAAGEILGFFPDEIYKNEEADIITARFNSKYEDSTDEFDPVMGTLITEGQMSDYLELVSSFSGILVGIFICVLSIVLWNAGLMGSLRRYGEVGVRLAIGEEKGHIYRAMLIEAVVIGVIGSLLGTIAGLGIGYYLQVYGLDVGYAMKNSSLLISNVFRARVTPFCFIIGFIPGIAATLLGTAISGIGIYKRETSQLFKELEV